MGPASVEPEAASEPHDAVPGRSFPIRVMLVEDSAVVRSLFTRILEADPDIRVVASMSNGAQAIGAVTRHRPDVAVLDIEMPVMDGLTALPKLIAARPGLKVIMASTLTRRSVDISLRALRQGAADYVTKPEARRLIDSGDFGRELLHKVKVLGTVTCRGRTVAEIGREETPAAPFLPVQAACAAQSVTLRPASTRRPLALAVGSSTGGPKALLTFLGGLPRAFSLPVVIVQHMPATFTEILAEHIGRETGRPCHEAADGERVECGRIYVAPGDHHLTVAQSAEGIVLRLDQGPKENFCRPAVDRLFLSVADCYRASGLAVVLTGMGQDGLRGARALAGVGGTVIVQDAPTSVVWGMPGAVATAGLASAVLPVDGLAAEVARLGDRAAP